GAPALSFAQAGIEGWTGVNADPYNRVEGKVDALKLMGESFVPFWLNGKLEGESNAITFLDFQGFRSSGFTESEQRDQNLQMMFPEEVEELGRPITLDD